MDPTGMFISANACVQPVLNHPPISFATIMVELAWAITNYHSSWRRVGSTRINVAFESAFFATLPDYWFPTESGENRPACKFTILPWLILISGIGNDYAFQLSLYTVQDPLPSFIYSLKSSGDFCEQSQPSVQRRERQTGYLTVHGRKVWHSHVRCRNPFLYISNESWIFNLDHGYNSRTYTGQER